jgi:hypothetical protein
VGNNQGFPADSLVSEERDGPLLTAAYERGLRIQEHLGVRLAYEIVPDLMGYTQQVIAAVQTGTDDYQLVLTHPAIGLTELVTSDLLYDMAALESVNLNKPYWATDMMDEIRIHGRYLLGYQDLCLMAADVVLFDKTLAADWDRAFLYEDVLNEVWTLERFMELSAGMFQDMDGDAIPSEYDMYGICILDRENLNSFLPASDVKVVVSDENGNYSVDHLEYNDKLFTLCDRIMELYTSMDVHAYKSGQASNQTYPTALFYLCNTAMLDRIKQKEIEFGILPYPKYKDTQETYETSASGGAMLIAGNIEDENFVGAVIEAMASGSGKHFVPAFYENFIEQGVICDDQSRENWAKMLGEWGSYEFTRWIQPDERVGSYRPAYTNIEHGNRDFQSSWDSQKDTISLICQDFYDYYLAP